MYWSYAVAALLTAKAALLVLSPSLASLSPLEAFLAYYLAIFSAAIALVAITNTSSDVLITQQPQRNPLLVPLSVASVVAAFLSWNSHDSRPLSFVFFVFTFTIGVWGLWEILFADSVSYSKTTGADKHTSSFIFGNTASASVQKKRYKQSL